MPIVRAQREVSTAALPGVRKSAASTDIAEGAGATGGAIGEALSYAGRAGAQFFGELARKERDAADQTALLKANNQLSDWKNKRLYDPKSGAFTLKGENALPLPEDVRAEFEKVAGDIAKGMKTPRQQQAFANLRSQEWQGIDLQVRRHVFTEMQTFRSGELDSLVKNSVSEAQAAYLDPKLVGVNLDKAITAIKTNAPALGMGKDQIDARVRDVTTATHVGVIQNLLAAEKDQAARVYFEHTKGSIDGSAIDGVTKAIEAGELKGRAQKTFDGITTAGGTLTEQRTKAKAITDADERDMVLQMVEHEAAVKEKTDRDAHEASLRGAFDVLDQGKGVRGIPPATWSKMEPNERAAAWSYARQRAEGIPIKTDQPTFYSLMSQAGDKPEDFIKANLLQYKAKLSDSDFQQLAGLQLQMKAGNNKAKDIEDLAGFSTKRELIDNSLSSYGYETNPAKQSTAEKAAVSELMRMLDRRIDAAQTPDQKTGKARKASNVEIQGAIDDLLSQGVDVPGSWWNIWPGGKAGPWGVDRKKLVDMTIDDVPPATRKDLERALRDKRRPVSDQTVLDLYLELQVK